MAQQTISVDEFYQQVRESYTLKELQDRAKGPCGTVNGRSDTQEQCDKYKIKACVVSYMNIPGLMCINPIKWAPTTYYISDTMWTADDEEKTMPFRVFLGEKD